jgi:hypothetical protein
MYGEACSAVPLYKEKNIFKTLKHEKITTFHCFIPRYLLEVLNKPTRHYQTLTKKGNLSVAFNQSAYNRQWLGGGT